jgi:hypothetical protein
MNTLEFGMVSPSFIMSSEYDIYGLRVYSLLSVAEKMDIKVQGTTSLTLVTQQTYLE